MRPARNVKKSGIVMQDLVQGTGSFQQDRRGQTYTVHRVDVPIAVSTTAEVEALDINQFTRARVYVSTTRAVDYIYDPEATIGLASTGPGKWVVSQGGASGGTLVVQALEDIQTILTPTQGLECYILTTGQTFIYVIEAGETTGQWTEKDQLGDDVDVTAASHLTLAQAQVSDLKVGQYVRLTDRGYGLWKIHPAGTSLDSRVDFAVGSLVAVYTPEDRVTGEHFGMSTTSSNCAPELQNAFNWCIEHGRKLWLNAGTFILGDAAVGRAQIDLNFTASGQSLIVEGEGKGITVLKAADGKVLANGRFDKMFYLYLANTTPSEIDTISFVGMTLDKSGASNGTPPTEYEWEQAHLFGAAWQAGNNTTVNNVVFKDIHIKDKVGSGINIEAPHQDSPRWGNIVLDNITESDFSGQFGERGDIEISAFTEACSISASKLNYVQIETMTSSQSTELKQRLTNISDCEIAITEFTADGGEDSALYTKLVAESLVSKTKCTVRGMKASINNSKVKLTEFVSSPDLKFNNSDILIGFSVATNTIIPVYPRGDTDFSSFVEFNSCNFIADTDQNINLVGYAIQNLAVATSSDYLTVTVNNCNFDKRFQYCYDGYANGTHVLKNNEFNCWGSIAVRAGAYSTFHSSMYLSGNTWDGAPTNLLQILQNSATWSLTWDEALDASDYKVIVTNTTGEDNYKVKPRLVGDTRPLTSGTTYFHKGLSFQFTDPVVAGFIGEVTANSGTTPTWNSYGAIV